MQLACEEIIFRFIFPRCLPGHMWTAGAPFHHHAVQRFEATDRRSLRSGWSDRDGGQPRIPRGPIRRSDPPRRGPLGYVPQLTRPVQQVRGRRTQSSQFPGCATTAQVEQEQHEPELELVDPPGASMSTWESIPKVLLMAVCTVRTRWSLAVVTVICMIAIPSLVENAANDNVAAESFSSQSLIHFTWPVAPSDEVAGLGKQGTREITY